MKKLRSGLVSLALLSIVACKDDAKKAATEEVVEEVKEVVEEIPEEPKIVEMVLESKSGSTASGKIAFYEQNGEVTMEAALTSLDAGMHAIHIHEKADCSSADGKSSGGHWNPTFEDHGKWGAETGYHRGDIGNFEVGEDGTGKVSFTTDQWCLGCDDEKKDILGKAIIVHQGTDDFTSQPSGAAGARISCGGIIE